MKELVEFLKKYYLLDYDPWADELYYNCWKDIPGYEGKYQVNFFSVVKSVGRVYYVGNRKCIKKEKLLKPTHSSGYLRVKLYSPTHPKGREHGVHRLSALVRLPKFDFKSGKDLSYKTLINHIDGVKHHNFIGNLEWCTNSENVQHAYDIGLVDLSKRQGENNRTSVLTNIQVLELRKLSSEGFSIAKLSNKFNISKANVSMIKSRKTWKHI